MFYLINTQVLSIFFKLEKKEGKGMQLPEIIKQRVIKVDMMRFGVRNGFLIQTRDCKGFFEDPEPRGSPAYFYLRNPGVYNLGIFAFFGDFLSTPGIFGVLFFADFFRNLAEMLHIYTKGFIRMQCMC